MPLPEVPLPSEEIDRRITELHKLHRNQSPAEAELNFLEHAKRLETYGISLHSGKDSSGRDIQLGVTSAGLVVFQNSLKINTFSWSKIVKISFKRKQFFIQLRKELTENYDTLLGFNLASYRSCKNLWKSAVEHHSFFRLHSPKAPPQRMSMLMNLGSKFRYSGRTEFQGSKSNLDASKASCKSLSRMTPNRKTLPLSMESGGGKREGKPQRVPRWVMLSRDLELVFDPLKKLVTGRGVRSAIGLGWLRFGMFHHPDGQQVATVTAHQPEELLKSKSTQPSR